MSFRPKATWTCAEALWGPRRHWSRPRALRTKCIRSTRTWRVSGTYKASIRARYAMHRDPSLVPPPVPSPTSGPVTEWSCVQQHTC